ncbi:hypothetical protein K9M09_02460, partial [Patescibacteria group bacterium]|nr:hypothetical protein [Patescibacteria group bacterium]
MLFSKSAKFLTILLLTSLFIAGFFTVALAVEDQSYGLNASANNVDAFKAQVATPDNNFLSTK